MAKFLSVLARLGKASSTVNNIARLLQLPGEARKALHEKRITEGHARAVLSLKETPGKQTDLLNHILSDGWSVRQAERFVISLKEGIQDKKEVVARTKSETPVTKKLSECLGTPVSIRRMAKGGKLEITFKTEEQLEKIAKILGY
jgi:ParB family transcriptional regulator, chromosome partitioning protein